MLPCLVYSSKLKLNPARCSSRTPLAHIWRDSRDPRDVLLVLPARVKNRPGHPPLGCVGGAHALLLNTLLIAAVVIVKAHPDVGVWEDNVLKQGRSMQTQGRGGGVVNEECRSTENACICKRGRGSRDNQSSDTRSSARPAGICRNDTTANCTRGTGA